MALNVTCFGAVVKGAFAAFLLSSVIAGAGEVPVSDPSNDKDVESLKGVLQRAADQGFVNFKDTEISEGSIDPGSIASEMKASNLNDAFPIVCEVSKVLDLNLYKAVSSYEDISAAKAGLNSGNNLSDLLPLVKTYMALGLGAEMTSVVKGIDGAEARLIESMGRIIGGQPIQEDLRLIGSYADCSQNMRLMWMFSQASSATNSGFDLQSEFTRDDFRVLEGTPSELRNLIRLKIGTVAAERKSETLAKRLLTFIAPETKYGGVPDTKDPAVLYFYALVMSNAGDPVAHEIFQHLAQYDGIYRVRSLQKLAENNLDNGVVLYDSFEVDLESVSQQYSGQAESLEASLQIILQLVKNDKFVQAIDKAKQDFGPDDYELTGAVSSIAKSIETHQSDALKSVRLDALAAFIYDPLFFKNYEGSDQLTSKLVETAIDLRLPELVSVILEGAGFAFEVDQNMLAFTKASIAAKHGDLETTIEIASGYKNDPKFEVLLLDAAIQSGNSILGKEILVQRAADRGRFVLEAGLAWQEGDWAATKALLKAMVEDNPDVSYTDEISLMSYLGADSLKYVDRAPPVSARDLEVLKTELDSDISLVKRILSNG